MYKHVESLVKEQVGWKDFRCPNRACVDEISNAHPGQKKAMT